MPDMTDPAEEPGELIGRGRAADIAALSLAGTGGAIAIVLVQRRRRRHGPGYAPVPAPRRPYDDQRSRPEELNGPRYR